MPRSSACVSWRARCSAASAAATRSPPSPSRAWPPSSATAVVVRQRRGATTAAVAVACRARRSSAVEHLWGRMDESHAALTTLSFFVSPTNRILQHNNKKKEGRGEEEKKRTRVKSQMKAVENKHHTYTPTQVLKANTAATKTKKRPCT
ncbi:hypothetical protein STCU_11515 [Strigomonas culicis]|uniref:Uncharacterized protein n=1 Tax=Strigomonas culicis TaxID=28005 RepID=S9TDR6_9TRYP|nr:hypothetical protein STCU_11515 [Strigomonas culicis]|eukprot:EPY16152.1 hypothetical protein STCU_11515 [Strigomonas culicis]